MILRKHNHANIGHEDNLIAEASSLLPDEYCRVATHAPVYLILGVVGEESAAGGDLCLTPLLTFPCLTELFAHSCTVTSYVRCGPRRLKWIANT
jgi:hypothetical protein